MNIIRLQSTVLQVKSPSLTKERRELILYTQINEKIANDCTLVACASPSILGMTSVGEHISGKIVIVRGICVAGEECAATMTRVNHFRI